MVWYGMVWYVLAKYCIIALSIASLYVQIIMRSVGIDVSVMTVLRTRLLSQLVKPKMHTLSVCVTKQT